MKHLYLLLIAFAVSFTSIAQTTIVIQDFDTPVGTPTMTYTTNGQGSVYTGGVSVSPDNSFLAQNDTSILTFSAVNTIGYTSVGLEFRLGSYTTGSNGADNSDTVLAEISPNNGTTWYSQILVRGNNNALWSFTGGTGVASKTYAANNTFSTFTPAGGGTRTTDGYSTVRVSGLPNVTQLRVRLTLLNNLNSEAWLIDDVKITGTLPCTTTPLNVTALTATPDNAQVTLNWTNSTCFDEMLVVAKQGSAVTAAPTGNGSAYTANAIFGNGTQITANEFVVYKGTGTNVNVTALTNNLTYHFRVYTRKGTNWSTGVPVSTTPAIVYCTPPANPVAYGTSIRAVSFGDTPYAPTPEKTPNTDPRYQNYTAQSTDVTKGSTSNLSVQIDTDGPYNVYTYAWIDWNQNGSFTDPGETYDLGNTLNANPGPTANSPLAIAIPASAVVGPTRIRVLCQYYGSSAPIPTNGPCEGATDGEVEDYTVNVLPPVTYVFNNGWTPSNPNGASTSLNDMIIANGNAVISSNISANSVTVSPTASLTVNPGNTFTVVNNVDMDSNSVNYSSLIVNGTLNANVTYTRHVNGNPGTGIGTGANDLIAPPVSGQSFSAFAAANNNLYENPANPSQKRFGPFSKASGSYVNWDTNTNGSEILTAGVGYRAASNDNNGFVFSGTPNNGVVTHNIVNSGPQFAAYNLIGNPYPSYINVREFLEYDVEPGTPVVRNIDLMDSYGAIYGYDGDASGTGSNGWTVYNLTTPTTVNITPGQGFLVTADAADVAAYDMTFTPAMRRIGNTDDFIPGRLADENNAHIKLLASMGTSNLTTDIFFNQASTSGLDFGYDAAVFGSNAASKAIYSQLVENNTGTDLAIQSLAYDAMGTDISIPLGINVPQGQQVTVSIAESSLPANMEVYLEDSLEGTFTLLNSADYTFTPNTNLTDTGRFFLRFADATLSSPEAQLATVQIYATSNPRALFVKGQLAEKSTLQVYDIQGRVVMTGSLEGNSNSNQMDVSALSSGPYIVVLKNSTQQKTQKIILR